MLKWNQIIYALLLFVIIGCERPDLIEPAGFETNIESESIVFAQIGDFGYAGIPERDVANMVKSWNPDFIVSVGDNNYNNGIFSTIKSNITNYYEDYIYNFDAPSFYRCNGKAFEEKTNRFFATPGNHDANNKDGLIPYYNYFTLPHNEIYYKFTWGPVTFYSINTVELNLEEQKAWLQDELLISTSNFNIIFLHHPPFSTGAHGDHAFTQWDFFNMGADIVFAGHDHIYERTEKLNEEGMFYIVNGLGGRATGDCNANTLSSLLLNNVCYDNDYGAVKGTATTNKLIIEFFAVGAPDVSKDRFEIVKL